MCLHPIKPCYLWWLDKWNTIFLSMKLLRKFVPYVPVELKLCWKKYINKINGSSLQLLYTYKPLGVLIYIDDFNSRLPLCLQSHFLTFPLQLLLFICSYAGSYRALGGSDFFSVKFDYDCILKSCNIQNSFIPSNINWMLALKYIL